MKNIWSIIRRAFASDRRAKIIRSPERRALLTVARVHDHKNKGAILEEASIDDLEWFIQILEYQLEETPNWVKDEKHLDEIQAWTRRVRSLAVEVQHNKQIIARRWKAVRNTGEKVFFIILGIFLAWLWRSHFG